MAIVFGTTLQPDCSLFGEIAALFAKHMGVQLHLVHVSEDARAAIVVGTKEEHILGPVRALLTQEASRLSTLHPHTALADSALANPALANPALANTVLTHLASGSVPRALLSVAELELANMVLVGGENQAEGLLGSTAEQAARQSIVPVLMLREPHRLLAWLRAERPLRVLVGVDLGRASEAARAFTATLRTVGPTEVDVVLVASPKEVHQRLGLNTSEAALSLAPEAANALQRELARTAPTGETDANLRVVTEHESADAQLVSLAREGNFDLIVVGQRRNSLLEQMWRGSVARGVLRASPVSVACVPLGPLAPKATFRAPRVVLVGTDFSEVGARAITQALGMVCEGGKIHLVHVIPPAAGSEQTDHNAKARAWYSLAKLGAVDGSNPGAVALERHVEEGSPAQQLLATADRIGADLIVLGARSHSIVGSLLGSVAQSVTTRATVPVLLVPLETS